jgi:hypothetical protein
MTQGARVSPVMGGSLRINAAKGWEWVSNWVARTGWVVLANDPTISGRFHSHHVMLCRALAVGKLFERLVGFVGEHPEEYRQEETPRLHEIIQPNPHGDSD